MLSMMIVFFFNINFIRMNQELVYDIESFVYYGLCSCYIYIGYIRIIRSHKCQVPYSKSIMRVLRIRTVEAENLLILRCLCPIYIRKYYTLCAFTCILAYFVGLNNDIMLCVHCTNNTLTSSGHWTHTGRISSFMLTLCHEWVYVIDRIRFWRPNNQRNGQCIHSLYCIIKIYFICFVYCWHSFLYPVHMCVYVFLHWNVDAIALRQIKCITKIFGALTAIVVAIKIIVYSEQSKPMAIRCLMGYIISHSATHVHGYTDLYIICRSFNLIQSTAVALLSCERIIFLVCSIKKKILMKIHVSIQTIMNGYDTSNFDVCVKRYWN